MLLLLLFVGLDAPAVMALCRDNGNDIAGRTAPSFAGEDEEAAVVVAGGLAAREGSATSEA